jgi:hypothetical protein
MVGGSMHCIARASGGMKKKNMLRLRLRARPGLDDYCVGATGSEQSYLSDLTRGSIHPSGKTQSRTEQNAQRIGLFIAGR